MTAATRTRRRWTTWNTDAASPPQPRRLRLQNCSKRLIFERHMCGSRRSKRSVPGIEPGTSCTRSRNHASRPNGRFTMWHKRAHTESVAKSLSKIRRFSDCFCCPPRPWHGTGTYPLPVAAHHPHPPAASNKCSKSKTNKCSKSKTYCICKTRA